MNVRTSPSSTSVSPLSVALLAFCALLAVVVLYRAYAVEAQSPVGVDCSTISSRAGYTSGGKYGSPASFFGNLEMLLQASCDGENLTLVVGDGSMDTYIFKYGYIRKDGRWEKFTYEGDVKAGPWLRGTATKTFSKRYAGDEGYVLAYVCERVQGAWKCGCTDRTCRKPAWQRQGYGFARVTELDFGALLDETKTGASSHGKYESMAESLAADPYEHGWEPNTREVLDTYQLSATVAIPGETLTISGAGFGSNNNDVLWNGVVRHSGMDSSNDGHEIEVTVPNLGPGRYELEVRHDGKVTEHGAVLWVKDLGAPEPVITSIEPSELEQGGRVTINGRGFNSAENDILTTFGVVSGVRSPDGTTLEFVYEPFDTKVVYKGTDGTNLGTLYPVYITVTNVGGTSNSVKKDLTF